MASLRGRALRPGGLVRALGRLVLLVALGFGVGLVFGLVTEEPELVARHLRGESEAVALRDAPAGGAAIEAEHAEAVEYASAARGTRPMIDPAERARTEALPPVAASASDSSAPPPNVRKPPSREAQVTSAVAAPPRARGTAVSPSAPAAGPAAPATNARPWAIQVGAFSDERSARKLANSLSAGYPVEVLPAKREGGRWRVRVQPLADEARARATADRLKQEEGLPTWVVRLEGRGQPEASRL